LLRFRQRSEQTSASALLLNGWSQTTQGLVGNGCSARYSARRRWLYSSTYSGFASRHWRVRTVWQRRHQLSEAAAELRSRPEPFEREPLPAGGTPLARISHL